MKNVVIADYVRTPFDLSLKGQLIKVRPDDLAASLIPALIERNALKGEDIEDVIVGCSFPEAEQGLNMARMIALQAGLPQSVGGTTVNRFCGSSMQAIHQGAGAIQLNAGEVFLCLGVESMTRVPVLGYNPMPNPVLMETLPQAYISMGMTAENLARAYQIERSAQEDFACLSQQKAAEALGKGHFRTEIIPAPNGQTDDGCPRPATTRDELATLKPAFDENGTVTAGTSSPLTDGAAGVLLCSEDYADQNGLNKLARLKAIAISGCAPETMGLGPVISTQKALARAGLALSDIDIIELNEAFAAQSLACIEEMGLEINKINLDGGALALGHPLGATGARITGKLASLMKREGAQYGLATQCIGGGQGIATILEAI